MINGLKIVSNKEEILALMDIGEISEVESDIKIYTIHYVLNVGNDPQDTKTSYIKGRILTYPTPMYKGYIFDGWYENSNVSGNKVTSTNANSEGDITMDRRS